MHGMAPFIFVCAGMNLLSYGDIMVVILVSSGDIYDVIRMVIEFSMEKHEMVCWKTVGGFYRIYFGLLIA